MLKVLKDIQSDSEIFRKRPYMSFELEATCDECGHEWKIVSGYPDWFYFNWISVNEPKDMDLYCNECDTEFTQQIIIEMSIKVIESE